MEYKSLNILHACIFHFSILFGAGNKLLQPCAHRNQKPIPTDGFVLESNDHISLFVSDSFQNCIFCNLICMTTLLMDVNVCCQRCF